MPARSSIFARARGRGLAVALATLASVVLLPVTGAHAVDPGRNGHVAFTIYDESTGQGGIYTEFRDGTGLTEIVKDGNAAGPAWSPDGKLLAYATTGGIRIVTGTGTFVRQLTTRGSGPTWSRDGKAIAFTIANSLYTVSSVGGPVRRLTTAPRGCHDGGARWSPTAPSVIFLRSCTTKPYDRIFTVATRNRKLHLVARDGGIDPRDEVGSPDFLPGGKRIVMTAQCWARGRCIAGNNRIVTANLNGGQRVSVTHDATCNINAEDCYPAGTVRAAPDGHDFLYVFGTNGPTCFQALHAKAGYCGGFAEDAGDPDWQPLH